MGFARLNRGKITLDTSRTQDEIILYSIFCCILILFFLCVLYEVDSGSSQGGVRLTRQMATICGRGALRKKRKSWELKEELNENNMK